MKEILEKNNLILFSNSLQYLQNPYKTLDILTKRSSNYLCIDSVPLSDFSEYVSHEIPPSYVYNLSYPIWILNKEKLISFLSKNNYNLIKNIKLNHFISKIKYYHLFFKKNS